MASNGKVGAVMVVGGGIAGMQSALDLAESGFKVYLVEDTPSIGGRMAQLDKTFPTNDCAMCTLSPKMVDAGRHINIEKLTYSEIVEVEGQPGHFTVTVKQRARSVDASKCTGCGECTLNCPVRYKAYVSPDGARPLEISDEDRQKVDAIIKKYSYKRSPLLSILQGINGEFNYLPEGTLVYLSQTLKIPIAHIVSVASFYSLFSLKPVGRNIISVCQGTACYSQGADRVLDRMREVLNINTGEMTPDHKFSLESVRCLGCCALAPVVKIGDKIFGSVKPKDVPDMLKGY